MKNIGIGIDDFKRIIEDNCLYIDKTKFIEDLEKEKTLVQLITRPRRFGKTLNMSMLNYFYNIEDSEENRKLFNNLYIESSPAMKEQGKYPVIFISLKDLKADSYNSCINSISILMGELYKKYRFLLNHLDELDKPTYLKYATQKANTEELQKSLSTLCDFLYSFYDKKIILLIDEYDTPMVSAYEHGYYDKIKGFFTGLYGSALKGNLFLKKAVLTGIMRIFKENIFSGLNNIKVNGILDENFSQYFGLTEEEVEKSLKDYNIEYKLEEIQIWYNGYDFGGTKVYNPFSITNFLDRKKIMPYWVNTSSNALINKILKEADTSIFEELINLFQGKIIEKTIDIYSNFNELRSSEQIWYLLTNAGYLTPIEEIRLGKYSLKIPNEEVLYFFERDFIKNFLGGIDNFDKILNYLVNGDFEDFSYELENIMLNNVSCFDFDINADEGYYHVFILGLILALRKDYFIHSNRESGRGRFDLMLEPKDKNRNGLIIEFKAPKKEEELEKEALKGIKQIEDNKYDVELKEKGIKNILLIGMAFYKKNFKIIGKRS